MDTQNLLHVSHGDTWSARTCLTGRVSPKRVAERRVQGPPPSRWSTSVDLSPWSYHLELFFSPDWEVSRTQPLFCPAGELLFLWILPCTHEVPLCHGVVKSKDFGLSMTFLCLILCICSGATFCVCKVQQCQLFLWHYLQQDSNIAKPPQELGSPSWLDLSDFSWRI